MIYDWRRVGLIDILSEALNEASGVTVLQCQEDFGKLTTEELEHTRTGSDSVMLT